MTVAAQGLSLRRTAAVVLLPMALLLLLGAYGLAARSFSLDELATLEFANQHARQLFATMVREQANMGLYYVAMAPWVRVMDTEPWVRVPSLVAAVMSVPVLFAVGRRLVDVRAALVATFLFATAALVVEHAETARSYAIATLAVLVATWTFLWARDTPDRRRIALYVLTVVAATYLHFVALMIVGAHAASVVVARRSLPWRPWVLAFAAIAGLCLPLLAVMLGQDTGQVDWIPALTIVRLAEVLHQTAGGTLAMAAFLAIGCTLGIVAWYRDRSAALTLVLAWAFVPLIVLVVVSTAKPLLTARFLLPFLPGALLLASAGIVRLPRPAAMSLAAVGIVLSVSAVAGWHERPLPRWRDLTDFVVAYQGPRDLIVYDGPASRPAIDHYLAVGGPARTLPIEIDAADAVDHPGRSIWVVVFQLDAAERIALGERFANHDLARSFGFDGVSLRQYRPRAGP